MMVFRRLRECWQPCKLLIFLIWYLVKKTTTKPHSNYYNLPACHVRKKGFMCSWIVFSALIFHVDLIFNYFFFLFLQVILQWTIAPPLPPLPPPPLLPPPPPRWPDLQLPPPKEFAIRGVGVWGNAMKNAGLTSVGAKRAKDAKGGAESQRGINHLQEE